jgi:hypothetical protein
MLLLPCVTLALSYTPSSPWRGIVSHRTVTAKMADGAFGASHTSMYTDTVAKDSYDTLDDILAAKCQDADLRSVLMTMFNGCGTITEALRKELVTVAEKQASVFGDVQLGVDVLADDLMWEICKTDPLIKEGASEEEPEVREMHADGKFCVCWDPLDGSSIFDNVHICCRKQARTRVQKPTVTHGRALCERSCLPAAPVPPAS